MRDPHDDIRALAALLHPIRDPSSAFPAELDAARALLRALHASTCPRCGAGEASLADARTIRCARCARTTSLTAGTALSRTRIAARHWVLATWHVFHDTSTMSARGFARRYTLRVQTAWALLHRIRCALPLVRPQTRGAVAPLLGRRSPSNRWIGALAIDDDVGLTIVDDEGLTIVDDEESPPAACRPHAAAALWLGRFRAWVCEIFRGVSRRYRFRYVREFAHRFGRVARLPRVATEP